MVKQKPSKARSFGRHSSKTAPSITDTQQEQEHIELPQQTAAAAGRHQYGRAFAMAQF
jgi:hypothetical protein